MSNISTLHNSYKCYDSIPTPSPTAFDDSKRGSGSNNASFMHQSFPSNANNNNSTEAAANLLRTASLDSLINSSEQDSGSAHSDDDDEISDSDSLTELANICENNSKNSNFKDGRECSADNEPRKSDIEELTNGIEPPKEPVIQAYLEKCHKKCEYKNCCFKKSSPESDTKKSNQTQPKSNLSSRRNSIASAVSVSRMETILEEPIEPKVSVKEILARFETLREAAEVMRVWK